MENEDELLPIDFLAYLIYKGTEESRGSLIWVRWTCLDNDIRDQYKREAMQRYDEWKRGESEAKARREKLLND